MKGRLHVKRGVKGLVLQPLHLDQGVDEEQEDAEAGARTLR
jgi:hypothetical protein